MKWETFNFTPDFQDAIFACLIRHPEEFFAFGEIVKPAYFTGPAASELMFRFLEYRKKYGECPNFSTLGNFAFHKASAVNIDHAKETLDYVEKLSKIDTSKRKAIVDLSLKFAKERAIYEAIRKIHTAQTEGKDIDPVKVMQEATSVGTNYSDLGVSLYHDVSDIVRKSMTRGYGVMPGYAQFEKLWKTGWGPGWLVVLLAPPKRYKCESPDTELLMFDGTAKKMKNIVQGDLLMGDDSTPRRVLSCGHGRGQMYRVEQANGDTYTVTHDHILCLKQRGSDEVLEITAEDYAKQTARFRNTWKGYKVGVEFPKADVPVDPYELGLWLSDRNRTAPDFMLAQLRKLGVTSDERVPSSYKANSRDVRLRVLAGIIDGAGRCAKNRGFTVVSTNRGLCEDTCWLARSLGFKSSVQRTASCSHVRIQGVVSHIPTKVRCWRGTAPVPSPDLTAINVTPAGEQEWFGVEIDGNRRYLHSDFTVTHNTAFAINLALNIAKSQDADVLYYACEITQELAAMRALCNVTGWTNDNFVECPEKGIAVAQEAVKRDLWGNIWFKGYPSKSTSISEIKAHARQVIDIYGLKPKAIVIDYAETVRPDKVDKEMPDWRQQADIYTQARAMGAELGCAVIMPDRCNKETVGKSVPSMKSFQGAFEKAGIVDAAIGLCATEDEYKHNRMRYFVFLNRHGEAFKHYDGTVDPERMRMTVGEEIEYVPEDEDGGEARPSRNRTKRRTPDGADVTQNY